LNRILTTKSGILSLIEQPTVLMQLAKKKKRKETNKYIKRNPKADFSLIDELKVRCPLQLV